MGNGITTRRHGSLRRKQQASRQQPLPTSIFLGVILISVYATIALPVPGGQPIPDGLALLGALFAYAFTPQRLDGSAWIQILAVYGLAFFSMLLGAGGGDLIVQKILSTLNFCSSLFVGYVVFINYKHKKLNNLSNFFLILALFLLFGAVAERWLPLVREISDAVRALLATNQQPYDADARDIMMTGIVRPKFFSLEPSYLAKSYALLVTFWAATAPPRFRTWVHFFSLIASGLFVMRSPTILAIAPAGLFAVSFLSRPSDESVSQRYIFLLLSIVGASLISLVLLSVGAQWMAGRISMIDSGHDISSKIRVMVPLLVANRSISEYPIFGIGLGGKHAIAATVLWAGTSVGVTRKFLEDSGLANNAFHNTLLEFWATFGIVGGVLIGRFLFKLFRLRMNAGGWFFAIFATCLSMTGPYVGSAYFWVAIGLAAAVAFARSTEMQVTLGASKRASPVRGRRKMARNVANA